MFEQGPDYNISQSQSAPEQRHHLPIIVLAINGNKDMETNARECLEITCCVWIVFPEQSRTPPALVDDATE